MNTMKSIKLYTSLIVVLIMFAGCSSDDDGPSGPQVSSNLFGEWTLDFLIINGELEGDLACEEKIDYKFNSDNTYTKTEFTTDDQDNCVESINFSGNWEVLTEQSIELTPNSSSISGETIEFELINSESTLEITRNSSRTEVYVRP